VTHAVTRTRDASIFLQEAFLRVRNGCFRPREAFLTLRNASFRPGHPFLRVRSGCFRPREAVVRLKSPLIHSRRPVVAASPTPSVALPRFLLTYEAPQRAGRAALGDPSGRASTGARRRPTSVARSTRSLYLDFSQESAGLGGDGVRSLRRSKRPPGPSSVSRQLPR
jgi:hypothetical protein